MLDKQNEIRIRNRVFNFYAENMCSCDTCYAIAEDIHISNIYETITDETDINVLFVNTTIIILTANKYERNILHQNIFKETGRKIKKIEIDLLTSYEQYSNKAYAYFFEWKGKTYLHIHTNVTGSHTITGSADVINWIKNNIFLFPTLILSFGVCFGTDEEKYNLGDVIISKKIYPYFIGAKINGEKLTVVDDNAFRVDPGIYNKIQDLKNNNLFNDLEFDVSIDNYLTGEAVVSSLKARLAFEGITTQHTPVGDMESYGIFKECHCNDFKIPCFVIKSICDWGVEKNFDANDTKTQNEFKEIICCKTNQLDSDIEQLLFSLKDRLQAYSADCAFKALDIIMENCDFGESLISKIKNWITTYNGSSTSYEEITETVQINLNDFRISCKPIKKFVNRCIILLNDNRIIKCNDKLLEKIKNDINIGNTSTSINIIKKECVCYE